MYEFFLVYHTLKKQALQFDVKSSQDEQKEEIENDENQEEQKGTNRKTKKKIFHFEYDIKTKLTINYN